MTPSTWAAVRRTSRRLHVVPGEKGFASSRTSRKIVPGETIAAGGVFVEAIRLQRRRRLRDRRIGGIEEPAVQRQRAAAGSKDGSGAIAVHLAEARRVP